MLCRRPAHVGSSQSLSVLQTFSGPPARGPGRNEGEAGRPLRETDPGQPVHGKQTATLILFFCFVFYFMPSKLAELQQQLGEA